MQEDPSVAARVVQVANSAFFRLPRAASSVEAAINHLGFITVRSLVLSVEIFRPLKWPTGLPFNHEQIASHSLKVAGVARALAADNGRGDEGFLAGLVHDIGYLVLAERVPDLLQKAATAAKSAGVPLWQREHEVVGAGHAEVGAYLLGIWGLPDSVVEATALHHAEGVEFEPGSVAAAVRAAEQLVDNGTCVWNGDEAALKRAREAAGLTAEESSGANGSPSGVVI